eukprot:CAMPEP_0184751020 /NCGR_PEP_ID=MMETSP0315-20130426/40387_1 /TAXON_ID=101924 /ORGANISM="Rhodosorus marinus, Strain UTEX LB 2760" /LENGTH=45 /DNA_ID= /DNA_START= /DNA_END= /DNA_ORIENTATION=
MRTIRRKQSEGATKICSHPPSDSVSEIFYEHSELAPHRPQHTNPG